MANFSIGFHAALNVAASVNRNPANAARNGYGDADNINVAIANMTQKKHHDFVIFLIVPSPIHMIS